MLAWVRDHHLKGSGPCPQINCASREVENGSLILAIKNKLYVIDCDVQIYLSHLELTLKWSILKEHATVGQY